MPQTETIAELRQRFGEMYRWRVLLTVMLGTMASIMASTIVNVAVPDMSRYFTLGQERAQWLSAGFMAAMTLAMLMTPWLLARFGYRRTYSGAVLLLMCGGMGGGLSNVYELVLTMRVAEGLAAGVLQPIPGIIIMRAFESHEQGRAMGIFGFGVVLAPALGPSIGGVLVEWFGWRSIFFVVVPFCLVALVLARRYLTTSGPGDVPAGRHAPRLDLPGLALVTLALMALLNGLVELHGSRPQLGIALLGLAVAALAGFLWHQKRAAQPLLQLALFAHRPFAMGSWVAFIYGMGLFGSTYLVPVFMQIGLALPPSQAGAVLLPAGLVLAGTIPIAGRLADRWPVSRLVSAGLLLLALSFLLMVGVGPGTALVLITTWAAVGRIGLGLILPSLNLGAMRGLPHELISQASSTINFVRQLGGAVGVSITGIVLEWRLQVHHAAPGGATRAFHETFVLVALVTAVAIYAAWRMGPRAGTAGEGGENPAP